MSITLLVHVLLLCPALELFSEPGHGSSMMASSPAAGGSITTAEVEWLTREAISEVKKVFQSRIQEFDGELGSLPVCMCVWTGGETSYRREASN